MQPTIENIEDLVKLFPKNAQQVQEQVEQVAKDVRSRVAELVAVYEDDRTYANTCYAYDRALAKVIQEIRLVQTLMNVSPDEEIRTSCIEAINRLNALSIDELSQNPAIYKALKAYALGTGRYEKLNVEQEYYIQEILKGFERNGIGLAENEQKEIRKIKKELGALEHLFETAISKDVKRLEVPRDALGGLTDDSIQALERTADGLYVLGVDYPTYLNVIKNCTIVSTRKALWEAFVSRAYPENQRTLQSIIALRDVLARKLGYPSFADYEIDDEMARSCEIVQQFLQDLIKRSRPKAEEEAQRYKPELSFDIVLSEDGAFQPWDIAFVKTQYKKKHFNFDERVVAEYFPAQQTLQALLDIYERFLSLRFKHLDASMPWHEDVKAIQVEKADGTLVGYLLLDLFPRPNKFTHACHITIVPSLKYTHYDAHPGAGLVIANFPKPSEKHPALWFHRDVVTFFHEFGHALHGLLGATYMASFSGTSVKTDFVEMPSQMFEQWMWDKEIIKRVSSHYKTGQKLPDEIIDTMIALKNFDSGDYVMGQVSLSQVSLDYFKPGEVKDTQAIWRSINKRLRPYIVAPADDYSTCSFGHLTGYGARYYSYLWSQVYAADLFSYIKHHGLLNPEIGKRYRESILSKGGSQPPEKLLHAFLGRAPEKEAFFKNYGI